MSLSREQMQEITGPVVAVDGAGGGGAGAGATGAGVVEDVFDVGAGAAMRNSNVDGGRSAAGMRRQQPAAQAPAQAPAAQQPAKPRAAAHQIVSGAGDEHHVLTTPSGQLLHLQRRSGGGPGGGGGGGGGKPHQPKFSSLVNEYVGACMEDNCNIGKRKNMIFFGCCGQSTYQISNLKL